MCRVPAGALAADVCPVGSAGEADKATIGDLIAEPGPGRRDEYFKAIAARFDAEARGVSVSEAVAIFNRMLAPHLAALDRQRAARNATKKDSMATCNCTQPRRDSRDNSLMAPDEAEAVRRAKLRTAYASQSFRSGYLRLDDEGDVTPTVPPVRGTHPTNQDPDPRDLAHRNAKKENWSKPEDRASRDPAGPYENPECTCETPPEAGEEHAKDCPQWTDPSSRDRRVPSTRRRPRGDGPLLSQGPEAKAVEHARRRNAVAYLQPHTPRPRSRGL